MMRVEIENGLETILIFWKWESVVRSDSVSERESGSSIYAFVEALMSPHHQLAFLYSPCPSSCLDTTFSI